MGQQYYLTVNIDKREFLDPHKFGDGLKLLRFGMSAEGTMTGLAILLADGNGRGGGDLRSDDPIIGSWAGDRIVIAGDYADKGNHISKTMLKGLKIRDAEYAESIKEPLTPELCLYTLARACFKDVSEDVLYALLDDGWFLQQEKERLKGAQYLSIGDKVIVKLITRKECEIVKKLEAKKLPLLVNEIETEEGKAALKARLAAGE